MKNYGKVRKILIEYLSDGNWHTTDELQQKCEEFGISFEGGRGSIYNLVHQLKSAGELETTGAGLYRLRSCQEMEEEQETEQENVYALDDELQEGIKKIEDIILKYRKFDWINCSEKELKEARCTVNRLLKLSDEIKNEFVL